MIILGLVLSWDLFIYIMNGNLPVYPRSREEAIRTGTWIADYELCHLDSKAVKAFDSIYGVDPYQQVFFARRPYTITRYLLFFKIYNAPQF